MVHRANLGARLARHRGSALEHLRVVLVGRVRLVDVPVNKLHRDSHIEPLARCLDTLKVADEVITADATGLRARSLTATSTCTRTWGSYVWIVCACEAWRLFGRAGAHAQLEALVVHLVGVCRDLEMAHIFQRGEDGCLERFGHRGGTSRRLRHTGAFWSASRGLAGAFRVTLAQALEIALAGRDSAI